MQYRSTRDPSAGNTTAVGFEDAVRTGLATDGGLFVPTEVPVIFELARDAETWSALPYHDVAFQIFRRFIPTQEIDDASLQAIVKKSYATFSDERVTPVVKPGSHEGNVRILELHHGPTFAFKDVALQFVGNLFDFFLSRPPPATTSHKSTRIAVLGATSGDTGGAAIYGLRGKRNVDVFILHPKDRISPVQEQQMTSVLDPNVHNIAVDGATFDDCQEMVKVCFGDLKYKDRHSLAAVNSINWARILAQTTYYFVSYLAVLKEHGLEAEKDATKLPRVNVSVPTGNFGDILAAYYAKRMGLPLGDLLIATNANDILHRFLETGVYAKPQSPTPNPSDAVRITHSPAMDILVSSNFERVLWHFAFDEFGGDATRASEAISGWMVALKTVGRFEVPEGVLRRAREVFRSQRVSNEETIDAIRRWYGTTGYVLDPHTAVGIVAVERENMLLPGLGFSSDKTVQVVLATASPGKFPDAVFEAIPQGLKYEDFAPEPLVRQTGLPKRMVTVTMVNGDRDRATADVRRVLDATLAGVATSRL